MTLIALKNQRHLGGLPLGHLSQKAFVCRRPLSSPVNLDDFGKIYGKKIVYGSDRNQRNNLFKKILIVLGNIFSQKNLIMTLSSLKIYSEKIYIDLNLLTSL